MSRIHPTVENRSANGHDEQVLAGTGLEVPNLAFDVAARIGAIDHVRLRAERLARVREQLALRGYGAALLSDPMNIRYATGTRNMAIWTMHSPGRYVFVPVDGPVVLFEFGATRHVTAGSDTVDETRTGVSAFYFMAGPRTQEKAELWAQGVIEVMRAHGGTDQRLAVDRCDPWIAQHLFTAGISLFDAQEPLEQARMIKTVDELACMRLSMDVCDVSVQAMSEALRPGLTENQLWSVLHQMMIAHDGEWIESRLLCSGERTNPWFQESGNRVIEAGDVVAFDTDMVGPMGYLADISRSLCCPGKAPTGQQRHQFALSFEQIETNIGLIKPGLSFKEFGATCWPVPELYVPNRYMMMVHGAGMVDEFPTVAYAVDYADWGYDGEFQENMVVCIESFIGAVGDKEGIKLEQQVLVTADGAVPMSRLPLDTFVL